MAGHQSEHYVARQTSYLTPEDSGDHTADADGGAFTQHTTSRPIVSGIEVLAPLSAGAVVALADSITDGGYRPLTAQTICISTSPVIGPWGMPSRLIGSSIPRA